MAQFSTIFIKIPLIVGIICYSISFYMISNIKGSTSDWVEITESSTIPIALLTVIGTFSLFISIILHYAHDPTNIIIYFIVVQACLALGLSYSSLAISIMAKCES